AVLRVDVLGGGPAGDEERQDRGPRDRGPIPADGPHHRPARGPLCSVPLGAHPPSDSGRPAYVAGRLPERAAVPSATCGVARPLQSTGARMDRMDRPLDAAFVKRQSRKRLAAGVTGLSLVTTAFVWGPSLLRPSVSRERVRIGKVETGPGEASITASGTGLPEGEEGLAGPMEARVLKILRRPGDVLKKGDPIVELDLSESILAVEKLDRDLALKVNKQASTRLDLEARLNEIEAKREIKRLELESLRSQLARNRT